MKEKPQHIRPDEASGAQKSRFGECKRAALPARVNRLPESVVASLQRHSHPCLCPRCSTLNKPTQGKGVLHINSRPHKVKTRIYEAGACQLPIRAEGRECLSWRDAWRVLA